MTVQNLGPLDWRIPIVTEDGRVTPEFQRRWASQIANNSQIGEGVQLGSGPPDPLPEPTDGAMYVDISTTPYTIYIASGGLWSSTGLSSANPTATASDVAVNGTADTFMRSDASPAVQKATDSQFGIVQVDGTTITETGGVISAAGGGGGGGGGPAWGHSAFDRRSLIGITITGASFGNPVTMLSQIPTNSFFWSGGTALKVITLDFLTPNIIAGWGTVQDSPTANGIWSVEGSPDNSTWTTIINDYVMGGTPYGPNGSSIANQYMREFTNSTAYRYYRLALNPGESSSSGPYVQQILFKCEPI